MPEDETPVVEHMGGMTPMRTDDGDRIQFGPQPNTALETQVAPDSGRQPLPNKGGKPPPPMTSAYPEAPDRLLEVLQGASIMEEHYTLMRTVIEKFQSTNNGLTKTCLSLLTGCEVSNILVKEYHLVDSSP